MNLGSFFLFGLIALFFWFLWAAVKQSKKINKLKSKKRGFEKSFDANYGT